MHNENSFKIEGYEKQFTVKELKVSQIITLIQQDYSDSIAELRKQLDEGILSVATNITTTELIDMRPSEIKQIWEKFKEVNATFFEAARAAGLDTLIEEFKTAIIADFSKWLVASSKEGMSGFLSTDIPTSSTPSTSIKS